MILFAIRKIIPIGAYLGIKYARGYSQKVKQQLELLIWIVYVISYYNVPTFSKLEV